MITKNGFRRPPKPADAIEIPDNYDVDTVEYLKCRRNIPREVTEAPIDVYSDASLAARLIHYEREALLERDPALRDAWKEEVARTRNEITRRRALKSAEAERVFK